MRNLKGNFWIQESFVNLTQSCRYSDTDPYETFTDDLGVLFRSLRREYGRATRMHCNLKDGGVQQLGWVFRGRALYDDCNETYEREVWVTVYTHEPVKHVRWDVEHPWRAA